MRIKSVTKWIVFLLSVGLIFGGCSDDDTAATCAALDSSVADTLSIEFDSTFTDISMTEVEDNAEPLGVGFCIVEHR